MSSIRFRSVFLSSLLILAIAAPIVFFVLKARTRLIGYRLIDNHECFLGSNTGVYEIRPHCVQQMNLDGRHVRMTTDEYGFRSTFSPPSSTRVLVLGGSILSGLVLSDEQVRPVNALAQLAREKFPQIQWINGSVQGYTTTHTAIRMREMVEKFKPAMVIVDTVRGHHLLKDAVLHERVQFDKEGLPVRLLPQREFHREEFERGLALGFSAETLNDVLNYFDTVVTIRAIDALKGREAQVRAWTEPGLRLLESMKKQSEAAGAEFVVLLDGLPINQNVSVNEDVVKMISSLSIFLLPRDSKIESDELSALLEKRGIGTLRFPPAYTKSLSDPEYLMVDRYHLNEKGSANFAKEALTLLAPRLEKLKPR